MNKYMWQQQLALHTSCQALPPVPTMHVTHTNIAQQMAATAAPRGSALPPGTHTDVIPGQNPQQLLVWLQLQHYNAE
jgi:hypothetical protein